MLKEVMEHLNHPPMEFRGVPFWSWNGKLEERSQDAQRTPAGK